MTIDGRIEKETAEIARFVVDLSSWLDDGEVIGSLTQFSLTVAESVPLATAWQVDYPFETTAENTPIVDTTPLVLTGAVVLGGTSASILVGAGTPGVTYIVSCIATGSTSGRRKQIDFYVSVNEMVNENMISSIDPTPAVSFTTVTGTTALSESTTGTVFVNNAAGAEITITLPPSPVLGQNLTIVDAGQNANTYTINIVGAAGALINGQAEYELAIDGQAGTFEWNGTAWVVT